MLPLVAAVGGLVGKCARVGRRRAKFSTPVSLICGGWLPQDPGFVAGERVSRPKFSLVGSGSACKTWCFAVFGWGLLGYASLSSRSSNARFWSSVGVVSCW